MRNSQNKMASESKGESPRDSDMGASDLVANNDQAISGAPFQLLRRRSTTRSMPDKQPFVS